MNSKRQCDLFGHTASYINTSLQRLAICVPALFVHTFFWIEPVTSMSNSQKRVARLTRGLVLNYKTFKFNTRKKADAV